MRSNAWIAIGSLFGIAALGQGVANVVGLVAHEMETQVEVIDVSGIALVDIDSDAGSVTINGADVDTITVRARIGHGLVASSSAVEVLGDRLVVRATCPIFNSQWCDVRYTIEVPTMMALSVRDADDNITVNGVDGDVELRSDNGSIRVDGLAGDVVAVTDNGDISGLTLSGQRVLADSDNGDVRVEMATAPTLLNASTENGNAVVVLPSGDELYNVDISSDNGRVDSGVRTDPASGRVIVVKSSNGNVTLRYAS